MLIIGFILDKDKLEYFKSPHTKKKNAIVAILILSAAYSGYKEWHNEGIQETNTKRIKSLKEVSDTLKVSNDSLRLASKIQLRDLDSSRIENRFYHLATIEYLGLTNAELKRKVDSLKLRSSKDQNEPEATLAFPSTPTIEKDGDTVTINCLWKSLYSDAYITGGSVTLFTPYFGNSVSAKDMQTVAYVAATIVPKDVPPLFIYARLPPYFIKDGIRLIVIVVNYHSKNNHKEHQAIKIAILKTESGKSHFEDAEPETINSTIKLLNQKGMINK